MAKIPGIEFDFGGDRVYTLPPLALGDLQVFQDRLTKLGENGALHPASIGTIVDVTHAALRRNYPEISRDDVGQLIDVGNLFEVIDSVMDMAGVKRKAADDAKKNPPNLTPPQELTGLASSPTSAQTLVGPGTTSEIT